MIGRHTGARAAMALGRATGPHRRPRPVRAIAVGEDTSRPEAVFGLGFFAVALALMVVDTWTDGSVVGRVLDVLADLVFVSWIIRIAVQLHRLDPESPLAAPPARRGDRP